MSLTYPRANGGGLFWVGAIVVSAALHLGLPLRILAAPPAPPVPDTVEAGATGAVLFDLSDIIAAPSDLAEDSIGMAEAEDTPTVTESAEVVDPAKTADQPHLATTPYEVEDDELKFGIASPEPATESDKDATEIATEYVEDQTLTTGSLGAVAAAASVAGAEAMQTANVAKAKSEGLTAEEKAEISAWQKAVVVKISNAKRYPGTARDKRIEGEVSIRFTIDRYGAVITRKVEASSGYPVLDAAALAVLDEVGKLPTPPNHLSKNAFTLIVPLRYRFR